MEERAKEGEQEVEEEQEDLGGGYRSGGRDGNGDIGMERPEEGIKIRWRIIHGRMEAAKVPKH